MIKSIKIKDYMAHKETELELGPGVTVLTGPNNSGKSAVVEALRSVAQNPAPQYVIRHGTSKAAVRVELDSGDAIEWVRSRGNSIYRLFKADQDGGGSGDDPEVYAKFGRMPPEDIRNLLRLDLVETESGPVDIHIGNQRYPIFLLDQTGSQAASFFAASTEAEYLLRMQQALKTKTDRSKSKRKELLQECADLEREIELYLPLEDLDLLLSKTEELHATLETLQTALPILNQTIEVLEETSLRRTGKMESSAVLQLLSPLPQIHETKSVEITLEDLRSVLLQLGKVNANAASLVSLSLPPTLQDTFRLDTLIQTWETSQAGLNDRRRVGDALEILVPPPVLHEIEKIEELVRSLEQNEIAHNRSTATGQALGPVTAPPDIMAVAPLQTLIGQLTACTKSYNLSSLRGETLKELIEPPELKPLRPLEKHVTSLEEVQKGLSRIHNRSNILAELALCAEPLYVADGDQLLGRLKHVYSELDANALLHEQLVSVIAEKRQEIGRVIQDVGLCPLCGHSLDIDHLLEATHG
jgi:DNA repair exonuclease SbcCD ATPase subunit